ncbi:hypothetical protein BDZ45DRAFT_675715 [Acephala macrosclerotiorum]|nr:hypothetical protein BDZ45DRAFT_675715 [Acephala macrosclerotiorum]
MGQRDCAVCNSWGAKTCGVCKSTHYCSVECQTKDFPLHRLLCDKIVPFLETDTQADNDGNKNGGEYDKAARTTSKLAIRFPAKSKHPELIWLKCIKTRDESDETMHHCNQSVAESVSAFMVHPAGICYRPDRLQIFMDEGSQEQNECLAFLNEGYKDTEQPDRMDNQSRFRGDIIVAKIAVFRRIDHPLSSYELITYANITLADLRVAFHTLTRNNNYFDSAKPNPYYLRGVFPWMKAVKVREKKGHEKSYQQVEVLRAMNIFDKNSDANPISRQFCSEISINPMSDDAYIVSRKDGKDVTPKQIEDLVYHGGRLDAFMGPKTADWIAKNQVQVTLFQNNLLGLVFPDLEAVKQRKLEGAADWAEDVCPRTID